MTRPSRAQQAVPGDLDALHPLAHRSARFAQGSGFGHQHLTDFGRDYVRKLNEKRVLVDLAHMTRQGFWDALEVHDKTLPPAVTHAGCDAVHPHFRDLTDEQLRAIADRGGVSESCSSRTSSGLRPGVARSSGSPITSCTR